MRDGDRLTGELRLGVQLLDGRIIPALDLTEKNFRQHIAVEREFARRHAVEIDHRHDGADHLRPLGEASGFELLGLQRLIGSAEGHRARLDLLDAAAGANRLIVKAGAGFLLVHIRPFRIDRIGEGGAGARNVHREGDTGRHGDARGGDGGAFQNHGDHGLWTLFRIENEAARPDSRFADRTIGARHQPFMTTS